MSTWEVLRETTLQEPISNQPSDHEAKWFAVQTRARHEKKVDAQLHEKGIESFLPLSNEVHQWSDRQRTVHQPLFAGYLFVHIPDAPDVRQSVLSTTGVCWFVGNRGAGMAIPEKQIQDVQTILQSDVAFTAFPFVRVGQKVRVRGGCLDGIEGILVSKETDKTVVVSVDLVRRSLAVHIDGYNIEEA